MVVTNVTKTLTIDQINQQISNQYNLTDQYNKKKHTWLQREIYDGIDSIFPSFHLCTLIQNTIPQRLHFQLPGTKFMEKPLSLYPIAKSLKFIQ